MRTHRIRPLARIGIVAGAALTAIVLAALPAAAHVTVHADTAAQGSYAKLTFRVPTELDNASTTKLQVSLPQATPIASVSVQPHPGWAFHVATAKLAKPIQTDDGPVNEAVSEITWTADNANAAIKPGEFDEFSISAGPLPKTAAMRFPAIQTYSNGQIVRWIQVAASGAPEPEHPAPALTLSNASATTTGTNPAPANPAAKQSAATTPASDGSSTAALTISIVALIVAALGAAAGVLSLRRARISR